MDKQEAWNAVRYLKDVDDLYPPTGREVLALARAVCDVDDRLTALDSASTRDPLEEYAEDMGAVDEPDHTCETCKYAWIDSEDCKRCDLLPVDRLPNDPRCRWTPRETPKADRMARYEEAVMDLYQGLAAGDEIELIRVGCGQTQPWSKTQQRFLGPAVKLDAWLKKAE